MKLIERYTELLQTAFGQEALFHATTPPDAPVVQDDASCQVSRGAALLDSTDQNLKSEIPGIPDECWSQFVRAMVTSTVSSVSDSNALGMFQMMPRRLADLGLTSKLSRTKSPKGRTIWVALFTAPMTSDKFLRSPDIQYKVFSMSMRNYADKIKKGEITKDPEMSMSGALAILHKAGPNGLNTWKNGERFPATQAIYDKISGIF